MVVVLPAAAMNAIFITEDLVMQQV